MNWLNVIQTIIQAIPAAFQVANQAIAVEHQIHQAATGQTPTPPPQILPPVIHFAPPVYIQPLPPANLIPQVHISAPSAAPVKTPAPVKK